VATVHVEMMECVAVTAATMAQIVRPPCQQPGHATMTGMLKMIAAIAVALSQILIAMRATSFSPMGALLVLCALMLCVLVMVSNFAMAMGIVILLERVRALRDIRATDVILPCHSRKRRTRNVGSLLRESIEY
jgi:hypothetical protein